MKNSAIIDALVTLRPGAQWMLNTPDLSTLVWLDKVQTRPTDAEILAQANA